MQDYFQQYMRAISNPLPEMADYFEKENDYLKSLVNEKSTILDVGCGNGRTMKFFAPYVEKIVGIDYDPKMIEAARQNLANIQNIQLIQDDFIITNFDKQFDLVFASYNLLGSSEINPKQRKPLLKKMAELTKTGEHLVISVWSDTGIDFADRYYTDIGIKVWKIKDNDVITNHGVFKRFTKSELEELSKEVGTNYKIIELSNIFYLLDISI